MTPAKVMVCLGTRPEVIKLAPVIKLLEADDGLGVTTVSTGQHREMLEPMLETFGIDPDVDLGLMRAGQGLAALTARAVAALEEIMLERKPEAVLVQGDTTTAFCAALAAFYAQVPVGHVEAGLRTGDRYRPFPEEMNRRLIASLATWHFCPTAVSAANLAREGVSPEAWRSPATPWSIRCIWSFVAWPTARHEPPSHPSAPASASLSRFIAGRPRGTASAASAACSPR